MSSQERAIEFKEGTASKNFIEMVEARWTMANFVCVGLDSQYEMIPEFVKRGLPVQGAMFWFNKKIVDATQDLVCAYKANSAFYEAQTGHGGSGALIDTVNYIHGNYPGIPFILDAKRGDIGSSNLGYVEYAFDYIRADAVTVHPYLGKEALKPFLDRKEKGIFVLARTSNPGAGEFQDLIVKHPELGEVPLYQVVAYQVAKEWNENGNCCLVAGATYPEELAEVRRLAPDLPILIPGIGKQKGDLEKTVKAGKDQRKSGMIIHSARDIIFASDGIDFAKAARAKTEALRTGINQYR